MPFIPAVHQCKAGWPTDLGSSRKPPTKSPFCLISGIGTKTGDVLVLKWNQKNAWTNGVILVGETGSKCKNALSLFSVLWHPLKVTRNQYQSRITCCFRCSSTSSDFSNISLQWDHLKWQSFRESQHKNNRVLWPSLVKHFPILVFGTFEWVQGEVWSNFSAKQLFHILHKTCSMQLLANQTLSIWIVLDPNKKHFESLCLQGLFALQTKGAMIHRKEKQLGQITSAGWKKRHLNMSTLEWSRQQMAAHILSPGTLEMSPRYSSWAQHFVDYVQDFRNHPEPRSQWFKQRRWNDKRRGSHLISWLKTLLDEKRVLGILLVVRCMPNVTPAKQIHQTQLEKEQNTKTQHLQKLPNDRQHHSEPNTFPFHKVCSLTIAWSNRSYPQKNVPCSVTSIVLSTPPSKQSIYLSHWSNTSFCYIYTRYQEHSWKSKLQYHSPAAGPLFQPSEFWAGLPAYPCTTCTTPTSHWVWRNGCSKRFKLEWTSRWDTPCKPLYGFVCQDVNL